MLELAPNPVAVAAVDTGIDMADCTLLSFVFALGFGSDFGLAKVLDTEFKVQE